MKKFLAVLAIGIALATTSLQADAARRFGGGMSFGQSAPTMVNKAPAAAPSLGQKAQPGTAARQQQPAAANAAANAARPSPWRGMLMGAAAALGIAALANMLGLGEGFTQILMMVLLFVVLWAVLRFALGFFLAKKMASAGGAAVRPNPNSMFESQQPQPREPQTFTPPPAPSAPAANAAAGSVMDMFSKGADTAGDPLTIPAGFDVAGFEKVTLENFGKMQQAWDTGNVVALSDFTTDDLFVMITHQLRDRGAAPQKTEAINVKAKLLGIAQEGDQNLAVVDFSGTVTISGEVEDVAEKWILTQPASGNQGWLLAGIQQDAPQA